MRKRITAAFSHRKDVNRISIFSHEMPKKTASAVIGVVEDESDGVSFAKTYSEKIKPSERLLVVIGMTGYEAYGANDNGDGFPAKNPLPGIAEKDLLPKHIHKFVENGRVHYLHNLSDVVGRIVAAFWSEKYQWVELVILLDLDKLPEEDVASFNNGDRVAVSMGCDVPYDVCSHCYHKSYTLLPDDRCTCINNHLHQVVDGYPVAMLSPSPDFDDISVVFTPADAIAFEIARKVASKGEACSDNKARKKDAELSQSLSKISSMYKEMRSGSEAYNAYKDLAPNVTVPDSGTSTEKFLDAITNGYPAPAKRIIDEAGLDYDEFIEKQDEFIGQLLRDVDLRTRLLQSVDAYKNGMSYTPDGDPIDNAVLLNIVNKLIVADKYSTSPFEGELNLSDIRDVIIVEHFFTKEK